VETLRYVINGANQIACVDDASADGICDDGEFLWQYDAYGDLLSDGVHTYTYDAALRLASVSDGVSMTTYAYNGDGDRVSQTLDGTLTTYVLDVASPLTMALAETTGTETITYLRGLDLIAQSDGTDTEYFLYDGLGSVRQLSNNSASILLSLSCDPYGSVYAESGAADLLNAIHWNLNPLGIAGRDFWIGATETLEASNAVFYGREGYTDAYDYRQCDPLGYMGDVIRTYVGAVLPAQLTVSAGWSTIRTPVIRAAGGNPQGIFGSSIPDINAVHVQSGTIGQGPFARFRSTGMQIDLTCAHRRDSSSCQIACGDHALQTTTPCQRSDGAVLQRPGQIGQALCR
jgi:YD repeat-containing protein